MSIQDQYIQAIYAAFPVPSAGLARYLEIILGEDLDRRQRAWEALSDSEQGVLRRITERILRGGVETNIAAGEGG